MINDIKKQSEQKMKKSMEALGHAFAKIRTGRANPAILESVMVPYYGSDTPLTQIANVVVEDARTLSVTPWEKNMVPQIEKAILKSDLGLNPSTAGTVIRVPMPALTEETRKELVKTARGEAENTRVAIRNLRRDANADIKTLLKDKEISEDEEKRGLDDIQKLTDKYIAEVDRVLAEKEKDLMAV
ncbi:ribosome recycling factor [Hahella aquimaris]|uniref:ribosome recycling factor n=1 Tax=Hahella sp. HNIBRBA332 TaxID=3015983 RepID=UPI00273C29A8|nr:ribosome recycling factor [Hahella sp. HNIBRBA332]WLQ14649.1 ribosome recycling factor [Hahella sp. HNIBRBA332]